MSLERQRGLSEQGLQERLVKFAQVYWQTPHERFDSGIMLHQGLLPDEKEAEKVPEELKFLFDFIGVAPDKVKIILDVSLESFESKDIKVAFTIGPKDAWAEGRGLSIVHNKDELRWFRTYTVKELMQRRHEVDATNEKDDEFVNLMREKGVSEKDLIAFLADWFEEICLIRQKDPRFRNKDFEDYPGDKS